MIFKFYRFLLAATLGMSGVGQLAMAARAVDTADTRLLSTPAIAEGRIAFVYAGDVWVADFNGANPRRVTSHPGEERNPYFSPDGKRIAFTGSYDGNVDVYVIPADGGEPMRLTWHPGEDIVRGFTPDGRVLFSSQRAVFSRRLAQFFTVAVQGGAAQIASRSNRRQGGHHGRWEIPGVYALGGTVEAVEELSGWYGLPDLDPQARRPVARRNTQAGRGMQRHRSDVDRRNALFSFGSRRRIQFVFIRSELKESGSLHGPRLVSDCQRIIRCGNGDLRTGRLDSSLRSRSEEVNTAQDRRGGRLVGDAAPPCKRSQAHPQHGHFASR